MTCRIEAAALLGDRQTPVLVGRDRSIVPTCARLFVCSFLLLAACDGALTGDPPALDASDRIDASLEHDAGAALDADVAVDARALPLESGVDAGCVSDRDGDLACDDVDVCPDVADAAQTDTDRDGVGDACECEDVVCEGTACITTICERSTGECIGAAPRPDGTSCDDGDACTSRDECSGGVCTGSDRVVCAASDACHAPGVCDPASGDCSTGAARPDGAACDDGSACTRSDRCVSGACAGGDPVVCDRASACRAASTCVPSSGECALGAPRADGSACSDGDACTQVDACTAGSCIGTDPVVCAPIDACHSAGTCSPTTGTCSMPTGPCTTEVLVGVLDARGAPIVPAPLVRAFVGSTATPFGGRVDASGQIRLLLPAGAYRFRAMRESGLPTWSGTTDHCTMPSCRRVEIRLPDSQPERAVSWEPYAMATYGGGEIAPGDPHIERAGVYLENWGVDHYGRVGAVLGVAHDHVGDLSGVAGGYGNPTNAENQHAFGEALQGIFVRLSTGGRFDLISVDYRIRDDSDPSHVSLIPGVSATRVEIWIATTLDLAVPATTPFTPFEVSSTGAEMTYWGTVFPTAFVGVTGVFITTTANVSIDNVVVRPRS